VRNFILFIRRFFNLILFLGLEIVCIIMIARTNMLQGNAIMSSANAVNGFLYNKQNDVVYYFGLRQMNDSLLSENAYLRAQLAALKQVDTLRDSSIKLVVSKNDSTHIVQYAKYQFHTARVISNSVTAANNYITINRGSADGIRKNMAVLSGNGLVGRVEYVSAHYASVLSILNMKQKISARLKDGTYSMVNWEGERPDVIQMAGLPPEEKIKPGDSVYTTGYSQYLPADVLIGIVTRKFTVKKDNSQLLYLRPATNFRNLQYVYVLEDQMSEERVKLEDSTTMKKK
jgi:rod shape-determining protein MreC